MNGVEVKCGWVEAVLERELKVEWMVDGEWGEIVENKWISQVG